MSGKRCRNAVNRGRTSPSSVWIEKRKGKRGVSYRVRWVDPKTGNRCSEACGRDLVLARALRTQIQDRLRDEILVRLPDKTIEDLIEQLDVFMAGNSAVTIEKTKASLRQLRSLCGDRWLARVDRTMIMDFRAKRLRTGVTHGTVNKDLRQIKSALSYAVDAGWLRTNPLWHWRALMLKEPEQAKRVVSPEEFRKLLNACKEDFQRALLTVAYYQGLRRNELANLRWSAIDLEEGTLTLENRPEEDEWTKSRKLRRMPLIRWARDALRELHDAVPKVVREGNEEPAAPHCFTRDGAQPLRSAWITRWFGQLVNRAGIARCTLHDLRRSWSTLAQRAGVDRNVVKELGGWSDVRVVERHYSGEIPEVFRRATETIERFHEQGRKGATGEA